MLSTLVKAGSPSLQWEYPMLFQVFPFGGILCDPARSRDS